LAYSASPKASPGSLARLGGFAANRKGEKKKKRKRKEGNGDRRKDETERGRENVMETPNQLCLQP